MNMKYKIPFIVIMWIIWGRFSHLLPSTVQEMLSIIPVIITICLVFDWIPFQSFKRNKFKKQEKQVLQKLKTEPTLIISETIHVQMEKESIDNIYVYYLDEKIASLADFKEKHPEKYADLLNKILTAKKVEIKERKPLPFESSIQMIENYNIDIPDEEVSMGLYHCANQLKYLQKLLIEYPQDNSKIRKLEDYYLPILIDILENYIKVSKSSDATQLKKKLNQTLVLVNEAIKNITHTLFDEDKLNLNVDMKVLQDLLKKDGLVNEMSQDQLKAYMEE